MELHQDPRHCRERHAGRVQNGNDVERLKRIVEDRDYLNHTGLQLPARKEYPEGHDYELFAVLALRLVGKTMAVLEAKRKNSAKAGEYALQAMDAVCHVEHLTESAWLASYFRSEREWDQDRVNALILEKTKQHEWLQNELEKQHREKLERMKQLNKARHALGEQARQSVIDEWNKNRNQFSSGEEAGNHFADWLAAKGIYKARRKSSNARPEPYKARTVRDWILDYAKDEGFKFRP